MTEWNSAVWHQFGATLDMLDDALRVCPNALWTERLWSTPPNSEFPPDFASFWYLSYHTIRWVDLYLFGTEEGFSPPSEFSPIDLDMGAATSVQPYSRAMLRTYLSQVRQKCQSTLTELSDHDAFRSCSFPWIDIPLSYFELQLYSMRHAQEHASQLHLFLGQHNADGDSDWIPRARGTQTTI